MNTRRVALSIYLALTLFPVAAYGSNRITLISTSQGTVYYHGQRLTPPYVIAASFDVVKGDTLWRQLYLNNAPIFSEHVRDSAARAEPPADIAALDAAARRANIPADLPLLERTRAIARAYASVETLIDSAVVRYPGRIDLYRKGSSQPLLMTMDRSPKPTAVQSSNVYLHFAYTNLASLLGGGAIVIGDGDFMLVPKSRILELQREVADIQRGLDVPRSILRHPSTVEEFRHPRSLPPKGQSK